MQRRERYSPRSVIQNDVVLCTGVAKRCRFIVSTYKAFFLLECYIYPYTCGSSATFFPIFNLFVSCSSLPRYGSPISFVDPAEAARKVCIVPSFDLPSVRNVDLFCNFCRALNIARRLRRSYRNSDTGVHRCGGGITGLCDPILHPNFLHSIAFSSPLFFAFIDPCCSPAYSLQIYEKGFKH
ncbi:hypothetical protein LXL04_036543 [Taraxacum kok-saghyz]